MSADFLDDASENESKERERLIEIARKSPKIQSTGHCLWCNIEVEHGRRWCSPECREDWELDQEANKRSGRW